MRLSCSRRAWLRSTFIRRPLWLILEWHTLTRVDEAAAAGRRAIERRGRRDAATLYHLSRFYH